MISHEHECIFIHIPKCAGTSIERALGHLDNHTGRDGQDHRGIRMIEQPFIRPDVFRSKENINCALRRIRYRYSPAKNSNNKLTVTAKQYNSYCKFTIIRNPWSRAFSWYKNVKRDPIHMRNYGVSKNMSFKDFLRAHAGKGLLRPQTYWLRSYDGTINLDYIGRFETLAESFREICGSIQASRIELPHNIKGSGEDYLEYFDDESVDIIAKTYQEEISLFDYSYDGK